MIGFLSQRRIRDVAVALETVLDGVEQGCLCRDIAGTKMGGAFEHQVLKVVSQSCGLRRVIARSGLHGDVSLQPWCLMIDTHVDLQPVGKGIDACVHRVSRHC